MIKAEPLIFPEGVRFLREEDKFPGIDDVWEKIRSANITTGYTHKKINKTFTGGFEANAHATNVFALFRDLVESLLPEYAAPIIGMKDEEPVFGPYTYKEDALAVFEPYIHQLQNDGFLEFGIIYQTEKKTEEIFVKASKYLRIFTNQPEMAKVVFARHKIPPVPGLRFIDEFPMVSESRLEPGKNTAGWPAVFYPLTEAFKTLPPINPEQ